MIFIGAPQKNVFYVPRPCIFKQDEKPVVYVKDGDAFEPQPVKIVAETESRVVVDGLKAGMEISLVNPTARNRKPANPAAPPGGPQ